ncbi:MAG: hypothetical protein WBA97_25285 [Actinophytocola sp.]|uniref:hypothetical protein n=1 Tax=Actinophytocola sp. TaxID=1872138 RepID=UPI003C7483E1
MSVRRLALLMTAVVLLASACASARAEPAAPKGLVPVTLVVPEGMGAAPLDVVRQALVPRGWTISVFARVPSARLAAWAPDGTLLVSVPGNGTVVRLVPDGNGTASVSVLLSGLRQPHGIAFAGSTLYVAQTHRVDAYTYADGAAMDPRPVVTGLPDASTPELGGRYGHVLKSVAVGEDGSVYVSVGSTGNISAEDLTATPPQGVDPAGASGRWGAGAVRHERA